MCAQDVQDVQLCWGCSAARQRSCSSLLEWMWICAVPPPPVRPQQGVMGWPEEPGLVLMVWGHLLGTAPAEEGPAG